MADEKVYTIPLRADKKTRVKRTAYAIRIIKDYLKKHTKADDVKLGRRLNENVWSKGTKKPPSAVKVKAVKDGDVVKAELLGFDYEEFKAKPKEERKGFKEKMMERLGAKAQQKQQLEEKIEGKEEKEGTKEEKASS